MGIREFLEENRGIDEAQRVAPNLALSTEKPTKPGGFKVSSKVLKMWKDEAQNDPKHMLFKKVRNAIAGIPRQELGKAWGLKDDPNLNDTQDFIAGKPRAAFNKWLVNVQKVSPKIAQYIRKSPGNVSLVYLVFMSRVSGEMLARQIFKRYFETDSDDFRQKKGNEAYAKKAGDKQVKDAMARDAAQKKRRAAPDFGRAEESLEEASGHWTPEELKVARPFSRGIARAIESAGLKQDISTPQRHILKVTVGGGDKGTYNVDMTNILSGGDKLAAQVSSKARKMSKTITGSNSSKIGLKVGEIIAKAASKAYSPRMEDVESGSSLSERRFPKQENDLKSALTRLAKGEDVPVTDKLAGQIPRVLQKYKLTVRGKDVGHSGSKRIEQLTLLSAPADKVEALRKGEGLSEERSSETPSSRKPPGPSVSTRPRRWSATSPRPWSRPRASPPARTAIRRRPTRRHPRSR